MIADCDASLLQHGKWSIAIYFARRVAFVTRLCSISLEVGSTRPWNPLADFSYAPWRESGPGGLHDTCCPEHLTATKPGSRPACVKLVVGASAAEPTSEAAGRSAIAVLLSISVRLAQNEVSTSVAQEMSHGHSSRPFPQASQAVSENQNTDARFRKASDRREADVITNWTTDRA